MPFSKSPGRRVRYYDTAPLYGLGLAETRLNRFLRGKPRDEFVLSTKIGRLLKATTPDKRDGLGKWFEVPSRNEVFDYSHDGVMRSVEFSLERLGSTGSTSFTRTMSTCSARVRKRPGTRGSRS